MKKGSKHTTETRMKMSKAHKGVKRAKHTAETRMKIGKANKGKKRTEEVKRKLSISHLGHKAWNKGKSLSKEIRRKMSEAHKGHCFSKQTRAKLSKAMIMSIKEGSRHPERNGVSGDFYSKKNKKTLHYRSQLEMNWYQLLEQMNKVKAYHVEPYIIPYKFEGLTKHYLPDLRIVYTDGTFELVEIKPESLWNNPKNQAKWKAARRWCKKQIIKTTFKVVGYEGLN